MDSIWKEILLYIEKFFEIILLQLMKSNRVISNYWISICCTIEIKDTSMKFSVMKIPFTS